MALITKSVALVTTWFLVLALAGMTEAATGIPVLTPGWNLVGLMRTAEQPALAVTELGEVTSVWKWTTANGIKTWAVFLPGEGMPGEYAASKGFAQLDTITPGEGFWVKVPATPGPQTSTTVTTSTTATSVTSTTLPPAISLSIPPMATTRVEVIANLDSGELNEDDEDRLFANWNGTNAAAINPSPPIDTTKYVHTTSITVYDSKGDSQDVTVYFDRTTTDNQWEFLITCDPTADRRVLTYQEQILYAPDTRYNYENHKGAGALLYGTIQFDTSGKISKIDAFKVPPDGVVDPSKSENRVVLDSGSSYFTFPSNFNGSDTNQDISINFGARYEGKTSTQRQVLVSDAGALDNTSTPITSATLWANVQDQDGKPMVQGDTFIFEGYDNGSKQVNQLVYTVDPANNIQDLLTQLEQQFLCAASIDGSGRLVLSDKIPGESGMFVTHFETISKNNATPFGGTHGVVTNAYAVTGEGITLEGTTPVTDVTKKLVNVMDTALPVNPLTAGDTFSFSGTRVDNVAVAAAPFAVTNATTIQDLLNAAEIAFGIGGTEYGVKAVLDKDGNIRIIDETHGGKLVAKMGFHDPGVPVTTKNPFGLVDEAADATLTPSDSVTGDINITTAKRMVLSTGRAFNSATGDISPILATTQWSSVYDDNKDPLFNGGLPWGVVNGDSLTFTGKKGDGTDVTKTFSIEFVKDGKPGTVQDLLTALETAFDCTAQIDTAGRLVLTDRVADTVAVQSKLGIDSITYGYANNIGPGPWPDTSPDIFGTAAFDFIPADISVEDGSAEGCMVSTTFSTEALSTTQYADSSTTIFVGQNGLPAGFLQSISTAGNGVISGHYSNGQVVELGQCACCGGN